MKVVSDKCSVKKVFLVVDRTVKVTCFNIKCCWLNEFFFSEE